MILPAKFTENSIKEPNFDKLFSNYRFIFNKKLIYNYAKTIRCCFESSFIDVCFIQIDASVIHLTWKHLGLNRRAFKAIRNVYGYHYSSYKEGLLSMKNALSKRLLSKLINNLQ